MNETDVAVLAALCEVPDDEAIEKVAERAGVTMQELRASMRRLALREPDPESPDEDRRGADVVVESDVGRLYLQAKSSRSGVRAFAEKRRRAVVGVVRLGGDGGADRRRARSELTKVRAETIRRRGGL